jgi:hypothetical protein
VGNAEFFPTERGEYSSDSWRKLEDITRQLAQKANDRGGFIGFVYRNNESATAYVNSWTTAIDSGNKDLALANTVEVHTLSGETIGLLVLPSHPMRAVLTTNWHFTPALSKS